MSKSLQQLYNKLIIERQKDATGFEKRESAQHIFEAYNPVCGDQFKLYLDMDDGRISEASYHGYGCALSKVSTSLLIEGLAGKTPEECAAYIQTYFDNLNHVGETSDEIIKALAIAKEFPGREQCTVLSWDTLLKNIESLKS